MNSMTQGCPIRTEIFLPLSKYSFISLLRLPYIYCDDRLEESDSICTFMAQQLLSLACLHQSLFKRTFKNRGGTAINEIADNTNYVLTGDQLSDSDNEIIDEAGKLGIPCVTLASHREALPDDLEKG